MHRKIFIFLLIIFALTVMAHQAMAGNRGDTMDEAMAKVARECAQDDSIDAVRNFVMNTPPKQGVNLETDEIKANRPLTAREKAKYEAYKERKKKLHAGAYLTKTKEMLKSVDARFSLTGGVRYDKVQWTIEGVGGYPDIISDLDWRDQRSKQVTFRGNVCFYDHYVIDASYTTGNITDGHMQDSDYATSGRQNEYSRSYSKTDGGDVYDTIIGLGYRMNIEDDRILKMANCDELFLTVLGGYSKNEQDLVAHSGTQIIPASGTAGFETQHTKYVTEWTGGWLGFELEGTRKKLTGSLRYQYHIADYYAWADWNLRTDFAHPVSFEHEATARGFKLNVSTNYHLRDDFSLDFGIDFQKWHTAPGTNTFHMSDGTDTESKLNEVLWDSYAFMFGGTYYFK